MGSLPVRVATLDDTSHSRRHLPPVPSLDHRALERTIPRGCDAFDADPAPAVDPSTWLDHVHFARTGSQAALHRLVSEYERYARSLARRMHRDGEANDDLDQIALEALVVALRRFDPERRIPFPAYATPTILGALRRHYRDHGWLVRVPRQVHEFAMAERTATEHLVTQLGRQPTAPELAAELDMDLDALLEAQDAVHARSTTSLDSFDDDGSARYDRFGHDDARFASVENRMAVAEAMRLLDGPTRQLLCLYYFEEQSQAEIAEHLGVSQMQVSRLLAAALRRLRQRVGPR